MTTQKEAMREALADTEPHPAEAALWRPKLERWRQTWAPERVELTIERPLGDPNRLPLFTVEASVMQQFGRRAIAKLGRFETFEEAEAFAREIDPKPTDAELVGALTAALAQVTEAARTCALAGLRVRFTAHGGHYTTSMLPWGPDSGGWAPDYIIAEATRAGPPLVAVPWERGQS